jgi:hypothetical protein
MIEFVLRTSDTAWISRNDGSVDDDGRVTVQVPPAEVEPFTFAGRRWLRRHFADCPQDAANPWLVCPAAWVSRHPHRPTPTTEGVPQ